MLRSLLVLTFVAAIVLPLGRVASAAADPTDGRFGGTKITFQKKYGEPLGVDSYPAHPGASVARYSVQGFGLVEVITLSGSVAQLTLQPIEGDTWTEETLAVVIKDFGPTDKKLEADRVDLGINDQGVPVLAIAGHSNGIPKHIGEPTYEKWGADGRSGDFHIKLFVAVPGFYSGLSFEIGTPALGTTTALPPAEEPTPEPASFTAAERAYMASVGTITSDMGASLRRAAALLGSPQIGDDNWTVSLAVELVTWQSEYQAALALTPPPVFEAFHALLLEGLGDYSQAADQIAYALDNFDTAALQSAYDLMQAGQVAIDGANDLLTQITDERGA